MNTQLFQSSAQVLAWLREIAKPMKDHEGTWLLDTGIARVTMPKDVIDTLLYGGALEHGKGLKREYIFVRDGKHYKMIVTKTNRCVFTWDHRNGDL